MHAPLNIFAISGSLRQASSNTAVLHAMTGVAPAEGAEYAQQNRPD